MYDLTKLWKKVEEDRINNYPNSKVGTVVYFATENYAWKLLPSLVSLLIHNEVEKVYIITETTEWAYTLPSNVALIDCSNQTWFGEGCKCLNTMFSNIILLRVVVCDILKEDKALCLDCDTIVAESISELWDTDLGDNYYLMVDELNTIHQDSHNPGHFLTRSGHNYNAGVNLMNLKAIRESGIQHKMVNILYEIDLRCPDQDAINLYCQDKILSMNQIYNYCSQAITSESIIMNPKILHYAGDSNWYKDHNNTYLGIYVQYYKLYIEHNSGIKFKDCLPVEG